MNVLFALLFTASAAFFLVRDPEGLLPALLKGGEKAATLSLSLLASYCVWLGFFELLKRTGLAEKLAGAVRRPMGRLFRTREAEGLSLACQNVAANLLGLPGAPTPLGIAATKKFLAAGQDYAAEMLFVLNATSLQILPTTAIALRAAAGATSPADILLPTLLATLCSTLLGVLLLWLTAGRKA